MQEETKKPEITWEEPEQLGAVPDIPDALLPPAIAPWIQSIAKTYSCQQCVPAALFMTLFSGLVGSRIGIKPYRKTNLLIYPNFWGGVVSEPGSGKTPIMNAVMQPFDIWNNKIKEDRHAEAAMRKATLDEIDAEINSLKSDMGDAGESDRETIKQNLADLYEKRERLPKKGRYGIIQDATAEAMAEIMRSNPGGITNVRDEVAGFLMPLDNEGAGGARAFMTEAQNGGRQFTQHRIKRGDIEIDSVTLTLVGGIQPSKLGAYIASAIDATSDKNDGLVQRLQMVVCPAALPFIVHDDNDECPSAVVQRILEIDASLPVKPDEGGQWKPLLINVDSGAHDTWCAWVQDWMRDTVMTEQVPHIKGHLSKFRSLMPSLALLFALLDKRSTVSSNDMILAGKWCSYIELHARRMYSLGNTGSGPVDTFIEKMRTGKFKDGMSAGDIRHLKLLGRNTPQHMPAVLKTLTDAGWIAFSRVGKKTVIRINPFIINQLGISHD